MQCDENGYARCVNKNRLEWEAWTIVYPHSSAMMTSAQLRLISLTATGAVLFPILGLAAGAMVPLAMSTFGTGLITLYLTNGLNINNPNLFNETPLFHAIINHHLDIAKLLIQIDQNLILHNDQDQSLLSVGYLSFYFT